MDISKMGQHMQYVENQGVCLNVEEKIKLGLAIHELMGDLQMKSCYFVGKITGKFNQHGRIYPSVYHFL